MTHDFMPDQALQIGLGFRASKVLLGAVELGVFTVVGPAIRRLGDSVTLAQPARALGTRSPRCPRLAQAAEARRWHQS
jgi:hypothetical protein